MTNQEIVTNFYTKSCEASKNSWEAHCWADEDEQYGRYVMTGSCLDWRGCTVLDVGSGQGDFYNFIKSRNSDIHYTGVDIALPMVLKAQERFAKGNFIYDDFLSATFPPVNSTFDYVTAIGPFNLRVNDQMDYVTKAIAKMWQLCRRSAILTLGSAYGDLANIFSALYYYQPTEILDICLKLTPYVMIKNGTPLGEMFIVLSRPLE